MKTNDVILQSVTKVVVFIILTLALYLFFSGHHAPGGGFIGGLVLASAFVLLYLAFDIETIEKSIPLDFKLVAAFGAMIAVATGFGALLFGDTFLSQTFGHFDFPFFGTVELTTITLFEAGVALTVVGVVVTIIISISKDV
ncbi:Na(+)/H(+) antiporter subunit B [Virgibacillus sp. W0181]|uniref:Na(+)/H(+) antiporter subunit B n=1 Tax=Virgibacillus sp. W0181 TaxID=3391581 RepID=UPI003F44A349